MSVFNLDKIFRPSAVAVVGASEKRGTIGNALLDNLIRGGYEGKIYPVNPHYTELKGLKTYPTLSDIGQPIDLAALATPIKTAPCLIEECAALGIGGAIIISAGGKEVGAEGARIEAEIKRAAGKGAVRLIGPNCLGVIVSGAKLNASFATHMPLPGKLAFISQSGAICTAILDLSLKEHIGFSTFVSIGSMLDVDFGDLINYVGSDPEVSSIVLYVENLSAFRKFMSAARAVSRVKPIVVLKAGRSAAGARAASSHTGALAGEDAVYDAAFKRAGILRVHSIEELFDCAELMAKQPRPKGAGLAVITNAGGPGVMAADALASFGFEPVALRSETLQKLNAVLPPCWSHGDPIDVLGDASPERYCRAVEICLDAAEIDSLLVILTPQAFTDPTAVAASLSEMLKGHRVPVFTVWMGGVDVEEGRGIFNRASIATYDTPERAVRAFASMVTYARNQEILREIPPKLPHDLHFDQALAREIVARALEAHNRILTEGESKALLSAYGIPVNATQTAADAEGAVQWAERMGYPVVMKIDSSDITHKSDAGGVWLNLKNAEEVAQAFRKILAGAAAYKPDARIRGVTVQPMLERQDFELIVGSKKDRDFGPVILFGMGGILTEVLKDRALALPPLNRLLASDLIGQTRVSRLLKGYRNIPAVDLVQLEEILIRVAQLVTDFPEITELDINPMVLSRGRFLAADARVLVEASRTPSPMHLVISPYPSQYETRISGKSGINLFIRPIKPEDAPLLINLFNTLSPRSIYYRFFRPLKNLSHEMLARLTQIDYDRDVVLVALNQTPYGEKMLGVARLMGDPDGRTAEFSIAVGDPWQGKGIGAELLERCIVIARERGMEVVWGLVLPENTNMLALGRKIGFTVSRVPASGSYELRIDLDSAGGERTSPVKGS